MIFLHQHRLIPQSILHQQFFSLHLTYFFHHVPFQQVPSSKTPVACNRKHEIPRFYNIGILIEEIVTPKASNGCRYEIHHVVAVNGTKRCSCPSSIPFSSTKSLYLVPLKGI